MRIHQDVDLYASVLSAGTELTHAFGAGRHGWLQVVRGEVSIDGQSLAAGDGAAISSVDSITLKAASDAELLLFDMG